MDFAWLSLSAIRCPLFVFRAEIVAEVVGHQLDLVRSPQPAAADHPIDGGLPGAAILPRVAEHRVGVALETLAHDDRASRVFVALLRGRACRPQHDGGATG